MNRVVIIMSIIVLCATGVRVGMAMMWQARIPESQQFVFPDSESYWHLARTIADDEPYQFGSEDAKVFRTPGYPWLLSWLFTNDDEPSVLSARMLSVASGTVTLTLMFWLGALLFDGTVGLLAAAIGAIYPGAIATSSFVLTEAPFGMLMILQLCLCVIALRSSNTKLRTGLAAIGGLVCGCAVLVRPSWILFLPLAICALPLAVADNRGRMLQVAVCSFLAMCCVLAPWWIRNHKITDHFVPTTLQAGASLYDGWNANATGASDMDFVAPMKAAFRSRELSVPLDERADLTGTFEYRLDRHFATQATTWAKSNPGSVLKLAFVKFVRMWNVWPNADELGNTWIRIGTAIAYVPVLLFGLRGVWQFLKRGTEYAFCVLPVAYFTILHMIFIGSIRYRQPAMLCLIIFAAAAVWHAIQNRNPQLSKLIQGWLSNDHQTQGAL